MNDEKIYVSRRSKTEIHTYKGRSLRTAGVNITVIICMTLMRIGKYQSKN
jgi:hypothetical protein